MKVRVPSFHLVLGKDPYGEFTWFAGSPGSSPIPNNLMQTIFCSAIAAGGEKEWDFLWQMYLKSNNANEKSNILKALGCSKEVWILQVYI
jgi:hypothetical protein